MTDSNDPVAAIRELTDRIEQQMGDVKVQLNDFRDYTTQRFDVQAERFDAQDKRLDRLEEGQRQTAEHLLSVHGTVGEVLDAQKKIIGLIVESK